jgi:predicted negative regulator of RcsB-dependent stress response
MTQEILEDGNRAFSELYLIRGNIFLTRGEKERAKEEFEKAVQYNSNFIPAKEALQNLSL